MQFLTPIYSRTKSEAEIQCDIYCAIKASGLEPRIQVRGYIPAGSNRRKCMFDIVVFWPLNHRPICIIECKKGNSVRRDNRQIQKYGDFGLPVLVCGKSNQVEVLKLVNHAVRHSLKDAPPSFDYNKLDAWHDALFASSPRNSVP